MRVYLAGPDVFYPDAMQRGQHMVALCHALGLTGLYPLNAPVLADTGPRSLAIYEANRRLIDSADAVVANLRDWRGFEPDSGTVWEAAYACAKGKVVVGYVPQAATLIERMQGHHVQGRDAQGCEVEDFGLPLNLMLSHSLAAVVHGDEASFSGLRAALQRAHALWQAGHCT